MLYLIGLGLGDADDITVRGLKTVQRCSRVYLETYTSVLSCGKEELERQFGKEIILADREFVEQGCKQMLEEAATLPVALLVVGDPLGATTHCDLLLRATELGVDYDIIHNASIITAIGCCGLQLYQFGEIVSIPFWDGTWEPDSFYDKIVANYGRGLHTLCLLDIKVKEQSTENLIRGNQIYEPPRFMSASHASTQLVSIIVRRSRSRRDNYEAQEERASLSPSVESRCVGLARIGHPDQQIRCASLEAMQSLDLGPPLHSLIIPAATEKLHELELQFLEKFSVTD